MSETKKKVKLTKEQLFNAKIYKLSIDFFNVAKEVQTNLKEKGENVSFNEAVNRTYNLINVVSGIGMFDKDIK